MLCCGERPWNTHSQMPCKRTCANIARTAFRCVYARQASLHSVQSGRRLTSSRRLLESATFVSRSSRNRRKVVWGCFLVRRHPVSDVQSGPCVLLEIWRPEVLQWPVCLYAASIAAARNHPIIRSNCLRVRNDDIKLASTRQALRAVRLVPELATAPRM